MSLARRADGALTVPITGEATIVPSENGSPLSTAFAQISDTSNTHTSSVRQSSSEPNSSSSSGSGSLSASNPKSDLNRAVIAVSVIMAVASIVVLIWYLRERRHDRNNMRERERRIRLVQSPRSVLPLQTSFHPSLKSSFGLTGASPDSQWSRTQGTITPLTRVAVQENLFSPMSQDNLIPSPQRHSPQNSGALPMPPVTANTSRTFRTSIRSIMVNRDSATIGHPSLADDFFPLSPGGANGRPRLTRLPSYHTDYQKTSPYIPIDQKRGFIPGPDNGTLNTSPSDYTSTMGLGHGVPPLPTTAKQLSEMTMSFPTGTRTTFIHPSAPTARNPRIPRIPVTLPHIRTRVRESELEYLNGTGSGTGGNDTPSSTASLRAMVNTSEPPSARPSRGNSLSEDLRGLLFLGSSVTVQERPVKETGPAAPDLSPTRGWSRLPDVRQGLGEGWSRVYSPQE